MAGSDVEKDSGYSGFERALFFVTPILFTAILLSVLLLMFNADWRNAALTFGNKIPVVKTWLPEPSKTTSPPDDETLSVNNAKNKIEELNALLAERDAALKQATAESDGLQTQVDELKAELDLFKQDEASKTITMQAYEVRIQDLANMYTKMTPRKAAPIMESMTIEEASLILAAMPDLERSKVLERMTPKTAASITLQLKDVDSVEDRKVAALQARIKELELTPPAAASTLDAAQVKATFAGMNTQQAAEMLLQLALTNQAKTLQILNLLDDTSRAGILTAMTKEDKKATTNLVSKLVPAKP